jgi:hypothetical protein
MKQGKEISVEFPNQIRFMQIEINNREIQLQLKLLTIDYNAQRWQYAEKVLELTELRQKLRKETTRIGTSDYDEGKRRDTIAELSARIDGFAMPFPPDTERFKTQKAVYEMSLSENDRLTSHLLIGQAQASKN